VIRWNTVYLGRAVAELRAQAGAVPDELLAHIAPLGWEHITFNGDYGRRSVRGACRRSPPGAMIGAWQR
jgi:Tn3 transposase DDE domain